MVLPVIVSLDEAKNKSRGVLTKMLLITVNHEKLSDAMNFPNIFAEFSQQIRYLQETFQD